ncbi:MAG: S-layer homology domain-containing protein [Syntrophomonadaceae bacterium]|nr:S-layer homology domain-containing protein [Syntrophomonadaceae bacterium]MDD3022322.1 S-layer homology domain-containing protein [Syntrophomonadaceae bacterium]
MKKNIRASSLVFALSFIISLLISFTLPAMSLAASPYDQLAASAMQKNYSFYQAGKAVDANWGNFSSYDAYILKQAGVDVGSWVYEGSSFKSSVTNLIDATIAAEMGVKKSSQRVAQDYLAAKSIGENEKAAQLLVILQARQLASGTGAIDGNAFSDIAALEMLGRAGALEQIDQTAATSYILGKQEAGAWPPAADWGPDFMATAQAVRALKYLDPQGQQAAVTAAINSGCDWLKSKQKTNGSFMGSDWDDPVVDSAEAIYTQILLGIDPSTWITGGKSALNYLQAAESYNNTSSNTWALDAYLKLGASIVVNPNPGGGEGGDSQVNNNVSVYLQVIGKSNAILFGPGQITISPGSEYGLTALGALHASGLSWAFSSQFDTLVEVIDGQRNEGMKGWMYKINDYVPVVPPQDAVVEQGDSVMWWYSSSADAVVPLPELTGLNKNEQEIKAVLANYKDDFGKMGTSTALKGIESKMTPEQIQALQKELEANNVSLNKEVGTAEAIMADDKQEVTLYIPEKALKETKTLAVQELAPFSQPQQYAVKIGSSVYEFGPGGTIFAEPLTITIKVPITAEMDVNNLAPAWYDENKQEWTALPGIIDMKAGLLVFQVDHFTRFALIELPPRNSFKDLDDDLAEAKDAIEILAGQGIVKGTGQGFEPYKHINRAEFVQLLVQALELELEQEHEVQYQDVHKSDWFARAVGIARHNNILAGYPDNTFRPEQNVNRYEIAAIIYKLKGDIDDKAAATAANWADQAEIPAWALNGVKYAAQHELLKANEDGYFRGESPVTRAEAALLMYKYLNL